MLRRSVELSSLTHLGETSWWISPPTTTRCVSLRVALTCNVEVVQLTQQELGKRAETLQLQDMFSNAPPIVDISLKHCIVTANSNVETYFITDDLKFNPDVSQNVDFNQLPRSSTSISQSSSVTGGK